VVLGRKLFQWTFYHDKALEFSAILENFYIQFDGSMGFSKHSEPS